MDWYADKYHTNDTLNHSPLLSAQALNMDSPDSKSQNILPTSESLNVKPEPRVYVEGAEITVPVRKRPSDPTMLRRALLGLVFILMSVLLFKWTELDSIYSWIKKGEIEFVSSISSQITQVTRGS